MLTAALTYAGLGWSVVPLCHPQHQGTHPPSHAKDCTRPGKQPVRKLVPLRTKPFTADDLAVIWQRNAALNVGVLTGRVSQLVAVDVDSEEALAAWHDYLGEDNAPTWQFASGRGLPHYLYRWSADFGPRGKPLADVHEKLDFLGEDMLTVMPPSLHKSGSHYRWTEGGPGSGLAIAECPARLLDRLRNLSVQSRLQGGGRSGRSEQVRRDDSPPRHRVRENV